MAAWILEYDLDGADVDYEDFNAIDAGDGKAEAWLTTFTQAMRAQLPQGQYILTHARECDLRSPIELWLTAWFQPSPLGSLLASSVVEHI